MTTFWFYHLSVTKNILQKRIGSALLCPTDLNDRELRVGDYVASSTPPIRLLKVIFAFLLFTIPFLSFRLGFTVSCLY